MTENLGNPRKDSLHADDSEDSHTNIGSQISGTFNGIKPLRTPGFNPQKSFNFINDGDGDVKHIEDSEVDSDFDDISSMASDF